MNDFKIGDMVVHKKHREVQRRIMDIKGEKALLWGFFGYVSIK